ncbi:MAG: DUF4328 domain-containing protein [Verrucomicrobiota bacterium JB022]|nr:DUF4328 domain-containing protein [Verrucomicrobiota bacterium JB022]
MIYIAPNGAQEGPFAEAEVRRRLEAGEVSPQTLYWQQGMADWQPLSTLFPGVGAATAGAVPPPPPPPPPATGTPVSRPAPAARPTSAAPREHYRSLRGPANAIPALIWSTVVCFVLLIVGFFALVAASSPSDLLAGSLVIVFMLVSVVVMGAGIVYLVWLYRAMANLRYFGAEGLNYSPVLTIVCYFLPIVSMIVPFLALRELSKASQSPHNWQAQTPTRAIVVWWIASIAPILCYFGLLMVGMAVGLVQMQEEPTNVAGTLDDGILIALGLGYFVSVAIGFILPPLCLMHVVKTVTRQQHTLRAAYS